MRADGGLKIIEGKRRFARSHRLLVAAQLIDVGQRLTATSNEGVAPSLILLHPKTSVLNADERNELAPVVFDEKNVVVRR